MAESLTFACIRERRIKRPLRNPGCLRGDADAAAIEHRKRALVTLPFFAEPVGGWNLAIGEGESRASRGMNAKLLLLLADGKSRSALLHQQRGNSLFALLRLRVHIDDARVRCAAVGDPGFRAVD